MVKRSCRTVPAGLVLTSVSERFPWTHTASQAQLLSQQYVNPVQLSNDELQDPPTAVQALHNRIAIAPIIMRRQLSYNTVFTSDPDSVCLAMGMNFDRVRLAMLSVMVSLFRSYRMYIRADASQAMQAARSASDEVMSVYALPLSAQLASEQQLQLPASNESDGVPAEASKQAEASEPRRRRPAPPSFSQLFAVEEFLAEQTHDESRTLLRYCVSTFMPFSVFIDERFAGHDGADLFDRCVPVVSCDVM